jgi:hypothetical protein
VQHTVLFVPGLNSTGAQAGNLYVAMYNWKGKYLRVQVIRSTDGGNT